MTTSFNISLYNIVSFFTLFFFLVTLMAEDRQVQPNSSQVKYHSSADHAIKKNIFKPLMERRNCKEDQITSTIMGRKGKHHEYPKIHHQSQKSYLWRDKSLSASAHEVPSGPNPISNR
ncbi:hypothetical protein K7X08_017596 [Anisodus acutangulus]|uniref:Transmembrane protein n=2 Tax=Anisodus TaxID=243963 RepID=A0A9Q1LYQ6_9SOLA|nr:hypothetical protein K7X08_017596 [Anisodus acutangulus]KAK4347693.1 hypothetical protein RND71_034032 [Anisodus tanguticus]